MRNLVKLTAIGAAAAATFGSGALLAADPPAGNAAAGKVVFAKCAACHTVVAGQNRLGPSLAGVIGRKAGSVAGYNYSPVMKAANRTWTKAELDAYLANPRVRLPGVKMIFAGLPSPQDRANLIAYLAAPQ